jgi:hypothetical protein
MMEYPNGGTHKPKPAQETICGLKKKDMKKWVMEARSKN